MIGKVSRWVANPGTPDVAMLEQVVAAKARPLVELSTLGDWQLRVASNPSSPANSVLALGDPGLPLAEALRLAREWYARRGFPMRVQTVVGDPLDATLTQMGWGTEGQVVVSIAAVDHALTLAGLEALRRAAGVTLRQTMSERWLAVLADGFRSRRAGRELDLSALRRSLASATYPAQVRFAEAGGELVRAVNRGVVVDGVLQLGPLEVVPSARREGLGMLTMHALLSWGQGIRAEWAIGRVLSANTPSLCLLNQAGFTTYYRYQVRQLPAS